MNAIDRAMQSYGRCCASIGFSDDLYRHLLASSPQTRAKFVATDMTVQKHLLRAGIMNLVMYARGMSSSKLRTLGVSYSRAALDIRPELYDLWLDALLMAIVEYDRDCDVETCDAWCGVTGCDIAVIKSYYRSFRVRRTTPLSSAQSRWYFLSLPEAQAVQALGADPYPHQP